MTAAEGGRSGPRSLGELLATFQAWSSHDTLAAAARRAEASGEPDRAARVRELMATEPTPPATEALAAQHELASLLHGWRWQTITAAREQGATWAEIAEATGSDPDAARADYFAQVARVEREAARSGFPMPAVELERYRDAGADDHPPDAATAATRAGLVEPGSGYRHDLPEPSGHPAVEETAMPSRHSTPPEHTDHAEDHRPRQADPVPDHELVSGVIVLPGGLPPEDDEENDAGTVDDPDDTARAAGSPGVVGPVPTRATLEEVGRHFDREGWSEEQSRAWEYLDRCRGLVDERSAAAARGDRVTVAVADADREWLDQAYQDWFVPRAAAQTQARLTQEPPLSAEAQARIEQWAAESATSSPAHHGDPHGGVRGDPRGDGPEILRRYAHALLGIEPRTQDPARARGEAAAVSEPRAGDVSGWWPAPDPTLPAHELTERELIARAEHCEQAATAGPADDQDTARVVLDETRGEAERRAEAAGPDSAAAQVAGYIGLVRDDEQHALAVEAGEWRAQLDALLPPAVVVEAGPDDPQWVRGGDAAHWTPERVEPDPADIDTSRAPTQAEDTDRGHARAGARDGRPVALGDARARLAAHTRCDPTGEQAEQVRRAQLIAWHTDDHDALHHDAVHHDVVEGHATAGVDSADATEDSGR